MAKNSSVNLDITNNADGFDISGGDTPRKVTVTGGDVTMTGTGSAVITFPDEDSTLIGTAGATMEGDFDMDNNSIDNCKTVQFNGEVDNGNSGGSDTIIWNNGQKQKSTLTDDCTYTFTAPTSIGNFLLKVIQDSTGSRTVTWPAAVLWPDSTAPTLSTGSDSIDIVSFYYDGTNYFGVASLDFS